MAQFFHPVVATNNTEKVVEKITGDDGKEVEQVINKAFQCVNVSFQSTSSCNIITVNYLNSCRASAMLTSKGYFDNIRYWVIEINNSRQIYIGTYSFIESIDDLIKNSRVKYRCWNY